MKKNMNASFNENNVGENIELYGWVSKVRNLGGLIFIDLRDRSGIIQLVVDPSNKYYDIANSLKSEYVIKAIGDVVLRSNPNNNIPTGKIEVNVSYLELLNTSLDVPFAISDNCTATEDTRLKYRYLDIRRDEIKNRLIERSKICFAIRDFLNSNDFIEVETPILCKSTPEGARDYLVPSRIFNGSFFALPQSPQLFKQLLMVGGIERYYQIARCFRDEDLRADRQPEFTQVDVEMSFVSEDDVMEVGEKLIASVFKKIKGIDIKLPLDRMKYDDAINNYGTDKPDLRFDIKINDITNIFGNTNIAFYQDAISNNGVVNAIVVKNNESYFTRKVFDHLSEFVKKYKLGGLSYLKFSNEISGSISKSISETELEALKKNLDISQGDVLLICCGKKQLVKQALGALRCYLARELNLIKEDDYKLLWVVDFPTFEWSDTEQRFMSMHHPFTAIKDTDIEKLENDKSNCYSKAYDIVINGYEKTELPDSFFDVKQVVDQFVFTIKKFRRKYLRL